MATLAVGPRLPNFGSWNWIAGDLISGLPSPWKVVTFDDPCEPPNADVILFLKFKPPFSRLAELRNHSHLAYMPVDVYGSCAEIDHDHMSLKCMDVTMVHCSRLMRYFTAYSQTEYIDHSLRYITEEPVTPVTDGPLLWVGKQGNISPFVEWCNQRSLDRPVHVLTDEWKDGRSAGVLGFDRKNAVHVSLWTPEQHVKWLSVTSLAVDIKGTDFRCRHKPPAKVLDFLASGLPVLINRGSSADIHLAMLGIRPLYLDDWHNFVRQRPSDRSTAESLRTQLSRNAILQQFLAYVSGIRRTLPHS